MLFRKNNQTSASEKKTYLGQIIKNSISTHLTISLTITIILVSTFTIALNYFYSFYMAKKDLIEKADEYISLLSENLQLPVWDMENNKIQQLAQSYANSDIIIYLNIIDEAGDILFHVDKYKDPQAIHRSRSIVYNDQYIGAVSLSLTSRYYQEIGIQSLWFSIITSLMTIIALIVVTGILLRVFLKKPFVRLSNLVKSYTIKSNLDEREDFALEFQPFVTVLYEMGDRIRTQMKEISQAEENFRGIFENAVEGIFQTSLDGHFLNANPAMLDLLGFTSFEELADSITDISTQLYVNASDRDRFISMMNDKGYVIGFETQFYRKNKIPFWVSISARVVKGSDALPRYYEGSVLDITARKFKEKAEMELKDAERNAEKLRSEMHAREVQIQKQFIDAFIQGIATAIDEKSPYTGGHVRRVVQLTMMIAHTINRIQDGPFKDIHLSEDEMEELRLAAWMHDIGKITTPEYVIDKATRLQTIYDRIMAIETRFLYIAKSIENNFLKQKIELIEAGKHINDPELIAMDKSCAEEVQQIYDDLEFLKKCNQTGTFMTQENADRVKKIASKTFSTPTGDMPFLTDDEAENLCIRKGSLSDKEREIIQNHCMMTLKILNKLPFPLEYSRVPEYAGSHHEKMDGTGYPKGLKRDELPLQSRIIAISDIFEALTAKDRPYRSPMKLSQALNALNFMKNDKHIDPDLYNLFIETKLFKKYAAKELNADQIDIDDNIPDTNE